MNPTTAPKRAVLYLRVSTLDQHPETQLHDLRLLAEQRGFVIVQEYTDRISGTKAKRPGLDQMMRDANRGLFDVVVVWEWGASVGGNLWRTTGDISDNYQRMSDIGFGQAGLEKFAKTVMRPAQHG